MRSNTSCCERHWSSLSELRSFRSAPAQNALSPAPVMTTHRYRCSPRKRSKSSHSSSAAPVLKALATSGRSRVTRRTASGRSCTRSVAYFSMRVRVPPIPFRAIERILADSGWPCPASKLEQAACIRLDDASLGLCVEGRVIDDDLYRLLVGDGKAVVAPHQHPVGADYLDQIFQDVVGVADRVVIEATQVIDRRVLDVLQIAALFPAPVEPSDEPGKRASRMGQADDEPGESIQHTPEDEMRGGDRRLERVAEQIREVVGTQTLVPDHLDRVQKKRQSARLDALIDGQERSVRQILSTNLGGYVEAAQAGQFRGALHLLQRERGLVHRQRREADEPLRMPLVCPGERIVVGLADALSQLSIGPVPHRLRQRQGVNLDTLFVHRCEPGVQVHELRSHGPGHQVAVLELRALALDHLVLEAVAGAVFRDQIEETLRKIMRVDVDRCLMAHRGSFLPAILPWRGPPHL